MRHCVLVLLALPVLASAFAPGTLKAPALRNGLKTPFARRQSGLKLARGAGRAERLQAAALKMVKDSGNAVHYEPFLGLEERDACGVGFIADMNAASNGESGSRGVLDRALQGLSCMEHRGACSADGVSVQITSAPRAAASA